MKIPEKVKIGGLNYAVAVTEHLKSGQDAYGEILTLELKINLRPTCEERQKIALLHEIIHGIDDHLGYIIDDERKVHELAAALYQVIIDNPELFS